MTPTPAAPAPKQMASARCQPPPPDLPPGIVRFYDNFLPPLASGSYRITASQKIVDPTGKHQGLPKEPFTQYQQFDVLGPRFRLDPSDVFSVFPPGSATGEFGDFLPQIVLTRRTLPWERLLGQQSPSGTPWLALLLLDEDEILDGGNPEANPTLGQTVEVRQAVNLPLSGKILTAQITLSQFEDPALKCRVIDVPPSVFTGIAPKADELPFLAHCRQVNTEDKEILGTEHEGWFSVVVGNRFPIANGRNIAHLVSLESFQDYLPGGSQSPAGYDKVRLISLASWIFIAQRERGNFASLMKDLNSGLLRMPISEEAAPSPARELVLSALQDGYTLVKYGMRQGEKTMAWYRGPLLPAPTQHVVRPAPFVTADSAMIYDRKTGLFDLSYATAWQIGRLVALADQYFALEMLKLRRQGRTTLDLVLERQILFQQYGKVLDLPQNLTGILEPHLVLDVLLEFLGTTFAALNDQAGQPLLGPSRDPSGLVSQLADLPGVLSKQEMAAILAEGGDPIEAVRRKVFEG
jgi:hypothetical protein